MKNGRNETLDWASGKKATGMRLRPHAHRHADRGHPGEVDYAKPMRGALRDVVEIVDGDDSGTYRVTYTVKLGDMVYVLHAFQKKSKSGDATPKAELELIAALLNAARDTMKKIPVDEIDALSV